MAKILKFDAEAREKLLKGINTLTEAVAATLGPKGRNVAIDSGYKVTVVHDGVTVAKEVSLTDPFENMGAQILKEAASKTNDVAGDGTTTATVLAQAMVSEGLRLTQSGANPMVLRRGIEKAVEALVAELMKNSKKITTPAEIKQVATISAQNEEIGKLISDAISKLGKDGIITTEEGKTLEMSVEYKEGMEFDKGYASPYMVSDTERMEAVIEDPYLLITDKKISSMQELLPFLEKFVQVSKTLVIIADSVEGDALTTLVLNKLRGVINVLVINAPGFGDSRKATLEDIAILTGGTVIAESTGRKFESVEVSDLGRAGKVISTKDSTTIIDGKGKKSAIEGRAGVIKKQIQELLAEGKAPENYEVNQLSTRFARLAGGVAVINVGAATEVEMKEKKERVIDAVAATRAAIQEGIVPGGEVALLRAMKALDLLKVSGEEKQGVELVRKAIEEPFKRLMQNAGLEEGIHLEKVKSAKDDFGIDVNDGTLKDLVKAGVIDPVKVTRSALQNAASVAIMVMTTSVLITDAPEKEKAVAPAMPGMGEY